MNRRELITGAGAIALTGCTPSTPTRGRTADPFNGATLMKDVEDYVGFGAHRTGSAGDRATSDWFARHFRAHGYAVAQTDITCPNADTTVARLTSGEIVLDGFAQPPLAFTPATGVTASVVMWNAAAPDAAKGRIACIYIAREGPVSPSAAYRAAFQEAAAAGAVGIIGVVSSPSGELVAINTPLGMALETPVLLIGEKDRATVNALILSAQPATLTITGPGGERTGVNTVATLGKDGDPWVIISTPQSGWFTCGGERGPGIAMHRALAAWAATQTFPVRWLFIATSGHEWVDAGAEMFHHTQAPGPENTVLWYHLGASFGARAYEETAEGLLPLDSPNLTRTLMATSDLIPICETAFEGQPVIENPLAADPKTALGEYRLVLGEGYPSGAGFWGGNAHFHTPIDNASSTTAEIMAPIARAIAQVIEQKLKALA